jgi:hypothetical protein
LAKCEDKWKGKIYEGWYQKREMLFCKQVPPYSNNPGCIWGHAGGSLQKGGEEWSYFYFKGVNTFEMLEMYTTLDEKVRSIHDHKYIDHGDIN